MQDVFFDGNVWRIEGLVELKCKYEGKKCDKFFVS